MQKSNKKYQKFQQQKKWRRKKLKIEEKNSKKTLKKIIKKLKNLESVKKKYEKNMKIWRKKSPYFIKKKIVLKNIFLWQRRKKCYSLSIQILGFSLWPEFLSPARFRIQGGWSQRDGQTNEQRRKSLCII